MKLDEIIETFEAEYMPDFPETMGPAMRAVFDKHVKPMLAEAFSNGGQETTADFAGSGWRGASYPSPEEYAAHIIGELTLAKR